MKIEDISSVEALPFSFKQDFIDLEEDDHSIFLQNELVAQNMFTDQIGNFKYYRRKLHDAPFNLIKFENDNLVLEIEDIELEDLAYEKYRATKEMNTTELFKVKLILEKCSAHKLISFDENLLIDNTEHLKSHEFEYIWENIFSIENGRILIGFLIFNEKLRFNVLLVECEGINVETDQKANWIKLFGDKSIKEYEEFRNKLY